AQKASQNHPAGPGSEDDRRRSVQYRFGNDAAGRKIFRTDYFSYTIRKPRLACLEGEPYTCGALEAVVVSEVADRGTCRYLGIDRQPVVETQAAAQCDLTAEPVIDVVDRCAGNIRLRSVEPFIAEIDQTIKVATAIGT